MSHTFTTEPLPSATAINAAPRDLLARFQASERRLANEIGRILAEIEAHPRHNEKVTELDRLLNIHSTLADCAKKLAERKK